MKLTIRTIRAVNSWSLTIHSQATQSVPDYFPSELSTLAVRTVSRELHTIRPIRGRPNNEIQLSLDPAARQRLVGLPRYLVGGRSLSQVVL